MPPTTRKRTATKAQVDQFGSTWQRGAAAANRHELPLPSGAVCLVKRMDPIEMIAVGIIEKMDVLTNLIDDKIVKKAKLGADFGISDMQGMSTEALVKMVEVADKITVAACIEPHVELAPALRCQHCDWEGSEDELPSHGAQGIHKKTGAKYVVHDFEDTPRDPSVIYTDGVPTGDKFAIMNFVMNGAQVVAPFPDGPEEGLDAVPAVAKVSRPAKRPTRNRR
jgi:hypothetical protein